MSASAPASSWAATEARAFGAERRAGPRGEDDDVARVAGPLAEEPRRRAGLELGPRRDDALGRVGPLRERFRDLRAKQPVYSIEGQDI